MGLSTVMVSTQREWRGGEKQLILLSRGLRERGHGVAIACAQGGEFARRARKEGLEAFELPFRGEASLRALPCLRRLLRERAARVVHSHDAHGIVPAYLASLGLGRLLRVHTRRVDFPLRSAFKYRRLVDVNIAISERVREVLLEGGVRDERVRVARSGIVPPVVSGREVRRELGADGELVVNAAALTDHKGQVYLLRAWKEVSERFSRAVLAIAGEGELHQELEREARELGVEDSVMFLGFRKDIGDLMASCDVFVMSSHLEGLGTAVMEAMSLGAAVVSTSAGGLKELVRDGEDGLLVPPRDARSLARSLVRALSDAGLRRALGGRAKAKAKREFNVSSMVEGTLRVYEELLGS